MTRPIDTSVTIGVEHVSDTFSGERPSVVTVEQGVPFTVETLSILSSPHFESGDLSLGSIPVTGPIFINESLPGDTLRVDILDISIADRGAMVTLPGRGGFSRLLEPRSRIVKIHDGLVLFDNSISLSTFPMVGKIGVAPAEGSINSSDVGRHGGNIDCRHLRAGTSIFLPVQVPGALLAVGDLHAVQGDGECGLTGVEVEGSLILNCSVVAGMSLERPVIMTPELVIAIGDGLSLDEAAQIALDEMMSLVIAAHGWDPETVAMFMSASAHVAVAQLVNRRRSVTVSLPRHFLESLGFQLRDKQNDK